jgi:hypothetical protein
VSAPDLDRVASVLVAVGLRIAKKRAMGGGRSADGRILSSLD